MPLVTDSDANAIFSNFFRIEKTIRLLASNNIPIPTEIPPKLSILIEIEKSNTR